MHMVLEYCSALPCRSSGDEVPFVWRGWYSRRGGIARCGAFLRRSSVLAGASARLAEMMRLTKGRCVLQCVYVASIHVGGVLRIRQWPCNQCGNMRSTDVRLAEIAHPSRRNAGDKMSHAGRLANDFLRRECGASAELFATSVCYSFLLIWRKRGMHAYCAFWDVGGVVLAFCKPAPRPEQRCRRRVPETLQPHRSGGGLRCRGAPANS